VETSCEGRPLASGKGLDGRRKPGCDDVLRSMSPPLGA
jgi:hypothetical protein